MSEAKHRPSQEAVIAYEAGKMGVAAVPGSGKTFTLSYLAASLVGRLAAAGLADDQEVLIVTFTNSAVNSFRYRIASILQQERGLLPYVGYRVRTLHGLAHDIVRMRPGLAGLSEGFEIADDQTTGKMIRELAQGWIRAYGDELAQFVKPDYASDDYSLQRTIRQNGVELVESIAYEVIKLGKDNRWEPAEMQTALDDAPVDLPLARIGIQLYADYQRGLSYRGAVDFDDLVKLAMEALHTDSDFLARLQNRWPYILEDEAQDSSKLQNEMLGLLSGERNWVRVGDPNQSIFTTFTTANTNLLREFLDEKSVDDRPLPVSGRSAPAIIALANELVRWSREDALLPSELNDALSDQQIEPTGQGDPQPNPTDSLIYLDWDPETNITPEREIERVTKSIERWMPDHKDWTVAVLVPANARGFKVAETLKELGIPYEELLRSTSATRDTASRLQTVFDFLAEPTSNRALAKLYAMWWETRLQQAGGDTDDEEAQERRAHAVRVLRSLNTTEDFLWPGPEGDWLEEVAGELDAENAEWLGELRVQTQRWLEASVLPVDQLVLTISQDLFIDQTDLALGHKIAVVLRSIANNNPDYRLPELSQELRNIAQNQRRFLGFDDTATGYEPKKGMVTVATMHAAKGLEWDRVYLMAVNNYSFPAAQPGDSYLSEKWFVRDELNVQAEARRQVEWLMGEQDRDYIEGEESKKARIEYAAERLRLLYVGITRAKRDLIVTWNMGRFWQQGRENRPAAALIALHDFWQKELQDGE